MKKEKYLINEAAKEVHVESHVLRYWEEELGLAIGRNEQGHRVYTQADIDMFIGIKELKDKGLQLKAVKTLLGQAHSEGDDDMRADNPFAQKQLTKISRLGETKMIALSGSDDTRWNEKFGRRHGEGKAPEEKQEGNGGGAGNMIEIKEMRQLGESGGNHAEGRIQESLEAQKAEQTMRLQYLFQKLIKEAVAANNEEMANALAGRIAESVKGDLCKELDYQFRLMEERDEERAADRREQEDKRNEDYYKRIDELLRQYSSKGAKQKNKEKTIIFPATKEKEDMEGMPKGVGMPKGSGKAKKEFHLFRKPVPPKTVEVK